ncbi:MAG: valine--tRNA ligase [Candidatus Pacearchaeota archaeon]|nr:valine--tRNA ligase [Candidatus Pacearchaeota archaeon]
MEDKEDYNFKLSEEQIKQFWEKEKIYKFKPGKKIYSVDTPPPTVSGKMHIGHAFQYSQMDFMARFKRMQGFNVFYPFGTDDNGLPTEKLIERLKNVKSKDMQKMEFIELCLKTLKEITPGFIKDWKDLAISCDYDVYYSTIDKHSQKLSQMSFIELFKQGEIYRKAFPGLWCVECQTAIAQAELEDKNLDSLFSTLKFSVAGKDLPIATTRPELLAACVGVFVNPKDKRFSKIVGKKARVPLFNFEVPVIADKSADMEKGTGVLMICSYGDKYDAEAITKYKLEPRVILNKDGTLNIQEYEGLKIKEARKKILQDLEEQGLVVEKKQIKHAVNVHDKCGTEIELLPSEQWFIKILDKKKKLLEQGNKVSWKPEFMRKRYENWVNGLEWDWNISRDRHFGIPIPIWECKECGKLITADEKELPLDPSRVKKICCGKLASPELKVFDTWQTSSISPEIASELVQGKIKQPYSVRCNAHDIIRTWDFYTIVKSLMHQKTIPWQNIMISGFVTLQGEKMSKTKGNVIAPQDITSNHGADSLRYWAASSKLGEDTDFQEKEVVTGKKFATKIWNASKFIFQNLKLLKKPGKLEEIDRLFLTRLNNLVEKATKYFEDYEYARAKNHVIDFFWHDFCDNYLEIVKNRIYSGIKKESAEYVLYLSLRTILKLMAPITPFITEELYLKYYREKEKEKSIHISKWPEKIKVKSSKDDLDIWDSFIEILTKVRYAKSKAQKSMKAEIILIIEPKIKKQLGDLLEDLKAVTSSREIKTGEFGVKFI